MQNIKIKKWRECYSSVSNLNENENDLLNKIVKGVKIIEIDDVKKSIHESECFREELVNRIIPTRNNDFILEVLQVGGPTYADIQVLNFALTF